MASRTTPQTNLSTEPAESELFKNLREFLELQHLYSAAIREIQTKLEILNEDFNVRFARNPIHHIESRLKSSASILKKLKKRGCEVSIESARKNLNDIAGILGVSAGALKASYHHACTKIKEELEKYF